MTDQNKKILFDEREFKGSRFRCLLATNGTREETASFLSDLAGKTAHVGTDHQWAPDGFCRPLEAKLDKSEGFLSSEMKSMIADWWLINKRGANTPNWDILSQCTIGGKDGLLLVEAKAHYKELSKGGCGSGNPENQTQIKGAIGEANRALNDLMVGFNISSRVNYQLANRFSLAWKLAKEGIPVVLVYLGCLGATEMCQPFLSHDDWKRCVLEHAEGYVPNNVWRKTLLVDGTPMTALIRSADINVNVRMDD